MKIQKNAMAETKLKIYSKEFIYKKKDKGLG